MGVRYVPCCMGDADSSTPGPNESVSQERIADAIRHTNKRAITATEIADAAELTNKTVYKHLETVVAKNDDIRTQKIAGSQCYWPKDSEPEPNDTAFAGMGGAILPMVSISSNPLKIGSLAAVLAVFQSFAIYYGVHWGIPLALWAALTGWLYTPQLSRWRPREWSQAEANWSIMQFVGLDLVLGLSIIFNRLTGSGFGAGGTPNLWLGVDVTAWLFVANTGFILGVVTLELLVHISSGLSTPTEVLA